MAWEVTDTEYTVSPEILRLRESNDPPSDIQAQKLNSFRSLCRDEVDVLDDRIADLNAELAWLLDQRSLRESQATVCTSLLSPFRRLPTEILGEIFLYCLPEGRCRTPSLHQAPLLLGQICSRWREIALGMSKLWEEFTMHINYESPDGDGSTASKHGNAAREWMSRVGETSLIDYTCEVELSTETCEEAPEFISHILLPYTHRLRRLDLRSWDAADFGAFLSLPSDRLPYLESAFLRFSLGETEAEPTVFSKAPHLRRLSLMSLSLVTDPTALFPWTRLTHLTVAGLQPLKWAALFRQCTELQHGVFILQESSQFDSPVTNTFNNAVFPYLGTLQIVYCNNVEQMSLPIYKPPTWLLENLEFLSLSHLDLGLEDGGYGFNIRALHRPPLLTSLSISNSAIPTEDLIVLLCESPGIKELELKNHDDYLKMFTRLTRDPIHAKSMLYLPNLEKLVIHAGPTSTLPYDSFSNMVRSRWLIPPPQQGKIANIKHVSLFVSKEWIDALVEVQLSLQQFEKQGLALDLKIMPLSFWDVQSREGYMEC